VDGGEGEEGRKMRGGQWGGEGRGGTWGGEVKGRGREIWGRRWEVGGK